MLTAVALLGSCAFLSVSRAKDDSWKYSASTLLMSQYYGTMVGGIFYPGAMSFTDVVASRGNSIGTVRFDLSVGQKLDKFEWDKDGGSEIDFTVGQATRFGPVNVDASFCYLALYDLNKIKGDCVSSTVRFDVPTVKPIQPYLIVTRFDLVGSVPGSGTLIYGGFIRNQPIGVTMHGSELSVSIEYRTAWSMDKLFGTKEGVDYHRLSVSLPMTVYGWTVTPTVVGQVKGSQPKGYAFVDKARVFATLAIAKGF